jgi:two-component system response regulator AtoC
MARAFMPHVLIVDDEPAVLFTLRELLEERGITVRSENDGAAAVAAIESGAIDDVDLVLTDYAMPGLDGMALLARLRAYRQELPVVLLTARGSERLAARAIKEGAFDYVPKPFDIDELDAVVARARAERAAG